MLQNIDIIDLEIVQSGTEEFNFEERQAERALAIYFCF